MAKYRLTKKAAEDIYKIWSYTVDTWSEKQAEKYYSRLLAALIFKSQKGSEGLARASAASSLGLREQSK